MAIINGDNGDNTLDGTLGADVIDGGMGADKMIGDKGNDIYIVDNAGDTIQEIDIGGIDWIKSSVAYAASAWVEKLTLTGSDDINATGNGLNNVLTGNEGDNFLNGLAGKDTMVGGMGNDTYGVDDSGDKVVETVSGVPGGIDRVFSSVDFSLASLGNVEKLFLTGTTALKATGNALNNEIEGNTAANVIDGGKGADKMTGNAGNDQYYVDNAGDTVFEAKDDGRDTVLSSIGLASAIADVEVYIFNTKTDVAFTANAEATEVRGGTGDDKLTTTSTQDVKLYGNGGDDTLTGGDGADTLHGDAGKDRMVGKSNSDTYYVDSADDDVIESAGDTGFDVMWSTVNIAKLADNVEGLGLLGKSAINGTGNDIDNIVVGNEGKNVLDGGKGADDLIGNKGDDTYIVDDTKDEVTEKDGGGIDLIKSSVSFATSAWVENLALTGANDIDAFGNGLNNLLIGNDGDNFLNGLGGKDVMTGGKGNDTYAVDDLGDKVVESVSGLPGGIDRVFSSVDFSLANLGSVEKLYLVGDAIKATGNALDNVIEGDDKQNVIDGGKGADIMDGGKGFDIYYIDNAGDVVNEDFGGKVFSSIALSGPIANIGHYIFNTKVDLDFTGDSEHTTIEGGSGDDMISGVGGFDSLFGHDGNDILVGGDEGGDGLDGGKGIDTTSGGKGNDHYTIDNAKDLVIEKFNEGTDTIISSVSVAKLADNVEDLSLAGKAALNGTGNDLDNEINGNLGKNILDGGNGKDLLHGNAGNDTLTGGSDSDSFSFNLAKANDGHDTITDFVRAEDILVFANVFDGDNSGTVDLADLVARSTVLDHGFGQAVEVTFDNGAIVTFAGIGTGAVNSIDDLVANAAQIHVS